MTTLAAEALTHLLEAYIGREARQEVRRGNLVGPTTPDTPCDKEISRGQVFYAGAVARRDGVFLEGHGSENIKRTTPPINIHAQSDFTQLFAQYWLTWQSELCI